MNNNALSKIAWLWIPLLIAAVQAMIELFTPKDILAELHSEQGPHEFIEFLFIFAAFIVAVKILSKLRYSKDKWLMAWVGLAAICSFYVAGEEISWGQHLLKWSTPEYWAHINDQGETNFHNTSSWLDQKPRLILLVGVVVGGLVIPALKKFRSGLLPAKFEIIYPPAILGVTSALAVGTNLLDKISEAISNSALLARGSEIEELYLFYFVLLYLVVLKKRVLNLPQNER